MRAKSRKLSIEHLDCRVLLAADVATLPDVSPVDNHGRDEIQVCFDHEAQQVLHGQFEDAAESDVWPDQISLPTGFEPEGIELGRGHEFFAGAFSFSSFLGPLAGQNHPTSLYAGAIYKGDLQTGQGAILVQPTGRPIAGLSYDVRTDNIYAAVGDSSVIGRLVRMWELWSTTGLPVQKSPKSSSAMELVSMTFWSRSRPYLAPIQLDLSSIKSPWTAAEDCLQNPPLKRSN